MTVLYLADFKRWLEEKPSRQKNLNWEEFFDKGKEYFYCRGWGAVDIPYIMKEENNRKILDKESSKLEIKEWITDLLFSSTQHGEVFYEWVSPYWSSPRGSRDDRNCLYFKSQTELSYEAEELKTELQRLKKIEEDLVVEKTKSGEIEQKFQFSESQLKICLNKIEDLEIQLDIQGRDWIKEREELYSLRKELIEVKKKSEFLTQQLEKYLGSKELVTQVLQETNQQFNYWKNNK